MHGIVVIEKTVTHPTSNLILSTHSVAQGRCFQRALTRIENVPCAYACTEANRSELFKLNEFDTTRDQADKLLACIFGFAKMRADKLAYVDMRVNTAPAFLQDSSQAYDSIDSLAARVHPSPSRFAHLFKKVVGVPVRLYVLWLKMRRALDLAIAGDSSTTAALSAGFSDSAHFSRSVRAMLGIAPEFLFGQR